MKFPITGITGHIKEMGAIPRGGCPVCYHKGAMPLYLSYLSPRIYHLPLFKVKKKQTALCLNCFSRLSPSPKALAAARRNSAHLVWPDEFKVVQSFV